LKTTALPLLIKAGLYIIQYNHFGSTGKPHVKIETDNVMSI